MDRLSKLLCVFAIACIFMVAGCAAKQPVVRNQNMTLPTRPAPIIMYGEKSEHKTIEKEKFPKAKWVKEPQLDSKTRRGYWSFKDIGTISDGLAEWEFWYKDVKELVEGHNNLVEGKGKYKPHSWWPW